MAFESLIQHINGWKRSRRWLHDTLGLFNAYRVRRDGPKAARSVWPCTVS